MSRYLDEDLQERCEKLRNELGGISAVARYLGVNKGLVSAAINHATHSPTLRRALAMPEMLHVTMSNINQVAFDEHAFNMFFAKARLQECEVPECAGKFYRIGNGKYCSEHSWATVEGRRYWRQAS